MHVIVAGVCLVLGQTVPHLHTTRASLGPLGAPLGPRPLTMVTALQSINQINPIQQRRCTRTRSQSVNHKILRENSSKTRQGELKI